MQPYRFRVPTTVVMAPGSLHQLQQHFPALGAKPLIVCGRRSARAIGAMQAVQAQFPNAVVFDQIEENPTTLNCEAGAHFCRQQGCDWILALGGGSPMDAAKVIALLAMNSGRACEYFGDTPFARAALPIVAIPTTAGTGSEVTPYAVLVDPQTMQKRTIRGEALFPRVAILDPALSLSLPQDVTLATGIDALSQAMEGFVSKKSNPVSDILALEVCRVVRRWLPVALREPAHLDARAQMLHAAMLSGCVIAQTGTTLVHGMGYYYTLHCGMAHGLANALLLPPVFNFNAQLMPERVAVLANALGGEEVADALYAFYRNLGLIPSAADFGVKKEQLAGFAADIVKDPSRFKNQIGTLTEADVLKLFQQSYQGACLSP